ncbi:MAG: 3-oxoacyl-ACP reductase, partial [Solirubrobacterales bacterium]
LAMVMFTFDLAEELAGTGVTVNSVHPASLMNTKMVFGTDYFGPPMTTVEEGAHAVEYVATSSEIDGVTGKYFEGTRRASAHPQAYDPDARWRLKTLSERLVKAKEAIV